jgi:glucose/arabinose dehydrogenase
MEGSLMILRSVSCRALGSLIVFGLVLGCGSPAAEAQNQTFRVVDVVDGIEDPWSITFLPSGDMLFTEKPGRLRLFSNGELSRPIAGVPEVRTGGQGGLFDVVLHPDFGSNQIIYLAMSKSRGEEGTTAIVRARLAGDRLEDVEEIFEADAWSGTQGHYGGRMVFDDEGHLFATIGDRQASPFLLEEQPAQNLSSHQGSIIRINDDGSVPSDNPFMDTAGARPEIWSYGHRSPQGLAIHPETGQLFETEHGPQGGDELNLIERGGNYGWPVIGYGVNYGGAPIHETTEREGMEQPVTYWVPSIATSGLMIYDGGAFPDWKGDIFVGGLGGQKLVRVSVDGGEVQREDVLDGQGRVRDIRQGPDGFIYIAWDRGTKIVRLEPAN